MTTFSQDVQGKNVDDGDWPQYFDKHVLTQPPGMTLVPDTNFLLRHYCSNVLYRRLKNDFNRLWFFLSRFVVLEIEARANRKKLGGRGKRLAFFAVKETRFLRENAYCNMLPALSSSDIADFSRRQGTGSVDAWIRHEIHSRDTSQIVLLTCDMMNAFAAEAEGLHTCYFCKQPQESFQMKDTEQLLNFIVSTTMIFGTIKVEWIGTDGSIANAVTYDAM